MEHILLIISCISRMSLVCLFRGPVNACLYLEPGYLIYAASYEMSSYRAIICNDAHIGCYSGGFVPSVCLQ